MDRRTIRKTGDVHHAAASLPDLPEAGVVPCAGRQPITCHLEHDQLGIDDVQGVPVETPPLEGRDPHVGDADIGPLNEPASQLLA